jgi:hypothetical protein
MRNCAFLLYIQLFYPFWGKCLAIPIWKKNWEKSPDMKDIQGIFQPNSSNFENSKFPIFSVQFQWVTKHIEFFFSNFHIWYIATRGWSRLWLITKLAMKTLLIWCALLIRCILLYLFLRVYSN